MVQINANTNLDLIASDSVLGILGIHSASHPVTSCFDPNDSVEVLRTYFITRAKIRL